MRLLAFICFLISTTAFAKIIRQDVRHLNTAGNTNLIGNVTLNAGTNITLGQQGQNIYITSTAAGGGGGGGGNPDMPIRMTLSGGVTPWQTIDGFHYMEFNRTLTAVAVSMQNCSSSGTVLIAINKNMTPTANATLTATNVNAGQMCTLYQSFGQLFTYNRGDALSVDISTTSASGEDITIEPQLQ